MNEGQAIDRRGLKAEAISFFNFLVLQNTDELSAIQALPSQTYFSCVLKALQLQKSTALVNARE